MVVSYRNIILYLFTTLIIAVNGQSKSLWLSVDERRQFLSLESCEDFSPDQENCTKFIRCFYNLRIKFTCPPGTAWENSLKTCVWKEYVEACNGQRQANQRNLGN
jgi:hypothetical protein